MVANAGIVKYDTVLSGERSPQLVSYSCSLYMLASVKDFQDVTAINAQGVFLCYKHAGLKMVEQGRGGRIIGP